MLLISLIALALGGCGAGGDLMPKMGAGLGLTRSAFAAGQTIPWMYPGNGDAHSPPLQWAGPPAGTASRALKVEDAVAPGGTPHDCYRLVALDSAHSPRRQSQGTRYASRWPGMCRRGEWMGTYSR
jgi:hypothetical protein